tara:strand:+ start:407 stop:844 length:438 start_codon:yes stop_codon:yes gene_type:complete
MRNTKIKKSIILFDGECIMCNRYVLFVIQNDTKDNFRFMSLQNNNVEKIIEKKNSNKDYADSILLYDNKIIKSRSSAVLSILAKLRFPYNLFSVFFIIPIPLRNFIYDVVARNRYKLFGNIEHCAIINKYSNSELVKEKIINNYY